MRAVGWGAQKQHGLACRVVVFGRHVQREDGFFGERFPLHSENNDGRRHQIVLHVDVEVRRFRHGHQRYRALTITVSGDVESQAAA